MECSNLPGTVACAVIQIKGGWTLMVVGYKSSFITKNEHEVCQLTRTKVQQQQITNSLCEFLFINTLGMALYDHGLCYQSDNIITFRVFSKFHQIGSGLAFQ
jgi:hypothetical protein